MRLSLTIVTVPYKVLFCPCLRWYFHTSIMKPLLKIVAANYPLTFFFRHSASAVDIKHLCSFGQLANVPLLCDDLPHDLYLSS